MKKKLLILTLGLLIATCSFGQYDTGIGIKSGGSKLGHGITVQNFLTENIAVDVTGLMRYGGYSITLLTKYQISMHSSNLRTTQLEMYLGGGLHAGVFNVDSSTDRYKDPDLNPYPDKTKAIGIDAVIGFEYEFIAIPFSLSLELKPEYAFVNPTDNIWGGGIALRYVFGRR